MPGLKFKIEPVRVKITDEEILSDLAYPTRRTGAPSAAGRSPARRRGLRR